MGIKDETLGWIETQASEFAGRLLVPVESLVEEFRTKRAQVLKKNSSWNTKPIDNEDMISMVAPLICKRFDVSSEVIEKRLRKEHIFDYLGL